MTYRLIALVLLILAAALGHGFATASGVTLTAQILLGYAVLIGATLPLALAWWRQTSRGW